MRAATCALWAATLTGLALAGPGCGSDAGPFAKAQRIESSAQGVGGVAATARAGDYLLENDQIRAIIEDGVRSNLPLQLAGSLIDLDLVRPEAEHRPAGGHDLLGQIVPIANLYGADPSSELSVRITGSTKGGAEITVAAKATAIQKTLDALGVLINRDFSGSGAAYSRPWIYTEYEVRPGERFVRITTTVGFDVKACPVKPEDGCNAECDDPVFDDDCTCAVPARCGDGRAVGVVTADNLDGSQGGILDVMLGELPRPIGSRCLSDADCDSAAGQTCVQIVNSLGGDARVCRNADQRDAGALLGDMLIFNGPLRPFVPGPGYDAETDIRARFDLGQDTLSQPLVADAVYATGDQISYGYASPTGNVLVPVFSGAFSLGATAAASCRHDSPGCLADKVIRFERYLSVGAGDVASAAEPLYQVRQRAYGDVRGYVLSAESATERLSGAEIYALTDPLSVACDAACVAACGPQDGLTHTAVASWTIEELTGRLRCMTKTDTNPSGSPLVQGFALSDPSNDSRGDGSFRMVLPPGRYVLVAIKNDMQSPLVPLEVTANTTTRASFLVGQPGRIEYTLLDERAQPIAGRVTVGRCFPTTPCVDDADCEGGTTCQAGGCACAWDRLRPLELGGRRYSDGMLTYSQTANGKGTIVLPPGHYQVIFSHGPEYTIERTEVDVERGIAVALIGHVARAVNREGWSAADFHVHSQIAGDGVATPEERVTSFVAEGMDFLSSADHDYLVWYYPILLKLGLAGLLNTQVGQEVSTLEIGHFLGFPLSYQEWSEETADQPRTRLQGNGAVHWAGAYPQDIFDALRALTSEKTPAIVDVPHPWWYFDAYKMDPVSLEPQGSLIVMLNPLVDPSAFSGDFDAMELLNSKSFDNLRRPTLEESRFYSQGLDDLLARRASGELDEVTFNRLKYSLQTEMVRRQMHRTRAEQEASLAGIGNDFECLCGSDGDCAAGTTCDLSIRKCTTEPTSATTEPPPLGMCRSVRGVIDDWFNMLNRGVVRTGVGGSDVHGVTVFEAGSPRTLVHTGATKVPYLDETIVMDAIRARHVTVTTGPVVAFSVSGTPIGDTMTAAAGTPVELAIRVEKAPWYDVDRVEIYRNGQLLHWVTACDGASRREGDDVEPDDHGCVQLGDQVLAWEGTIEDTPPEDAWYVVIAMGLDGRTFSPVYSSLPLARLGTTEISQRIYDLVPVLASFRMPRYPSLFPTFPFAVTNPIWVDLGGDGWTPSEPPPSWCSPERDFSCE